MSPETTRSPRLGAIGKQSLNAIDGTEARRGDGRIIPRDAGTQSREAVDCLGRPYRGRSRRLRLLVIAAPGDDPIFDNRV